jgi:phosphate:Na+ symporter
VEAARRTTMEIAAALLLLLDEILARPGTRPPAPALEAAQLGLVETRHFLARVHTEQAAGDHERHLAVLHAMDHLERLVERLRGTPGTTEVGPDLLAAAVDTRRELDAVRQWLGGEDTADAPAGSAAASRCETLTHDLAERRRVQRIQHLQAAAAGELDPDLAMDWLDAMRWLDSSVYHVWRVVHHLATRTADTQTEARS